MRYIAIVLLAMLAACDSPTSEVAAPAPDPFYEGAPERPRIRLTVLAGTKKAPAAVGRVRIEARWPEIWSTSADYGVGFYGGATIIEGVPEKMAVGDLYFLRARGRDSSSAVIEFQCTGDSVEFAVRPCTAVGGGIVDGAVDAWSGDKVVTKEVDAAFATVFCKG